MALDFSQYARSYAPGINVPQSNQPGLVGQGLSQIRTFADKFQQRQTDELNEYFGSAGFSQLLNPDITTWGEIDIPNAGKAYLDFKAGIKDDTGFGAKRFARKSKRLLNPMTFKQEYDNYMQAYIPSILNNLSSYAIVNNKTKKQMVELLKDKPGLKSLLVRNMPADQLASYPYLTPEKTWGEWWQGKTAGEKAGTVVTPLIPGALGVTAGRDIAKRGFAARYSPKGKKRMLQMGEKGTERAIKALGLRGKTTALDKKAIKSAQSAQSKASRAITSAKKLYKGKKIPFEKSPQGIKLGKARQAKVLATKATKAKAASGPTRTLTNFIKKKGVPALMRKVIKKAGWKGAAKMLGRGALSLGLKGTGVGALASLALDASTVIWLYNIVTSEE